MKKKYRSIEKRFIILLLWMAMAFPIMIMAQTLYYVAPTGNDKNAGTIDSPFQTIVKAQQQAQTQTGEVTVFLRESVYRLKDPLVFTLKDGNATKKLTLRSYPNEKVVISGSTLLSPQWKPYKNGIMMAKITSPGAMDMLTVNGEIRHMARYPNYDPNAIRFNGTSADATSPDRVKQWKDPTGGYLHAMHRSDWGDFHYRITGKDKEGNLFLEGGHQNNRQSGLSRDNRMVENIFEELDAPGEWYYDHQKNILYYYPMPEEDVHHSSFEVPQLKHLIEFRGRKDNPVKNIQIQDIAFTQTNRTFMEKYEPLLRSDWMVYRGGAILFEGTENCNISQCDLYNLGGNAVFFSNYNRNSTVSGCHFTRIGASAICFVGDPDAVRSPSFEYGQSVPLEEMDRVPGPKTNNYPAGCTVHDNLIHKIGLFEKQTTGIELSMCHGITVSHNSIYDVPRAGINVSEGTWGGHVIEFNDIFDTVKETGDHGSFNSWGRDRFWHPNLSRMKQIVREEPTLILADMISTIVMRNNRFRCDRGWDIDLDDGSTNYHIYNNLCLNGGIKLREGFYRVVENNILVNNTFHPHVWFEKSGDVFTRNIVMTPYQPINVSYWGAMTDYNIFTDQEAYEAARKNDTDHHSIVSPIRFQDAEKGNYRITLDSDDVFWLGFLNFDMERFGVVSSRLKVQAKTPKMTIPVIKTENATSDLIEWQGFNIKNLETLGERSATGMDSERGVYIVTMIKYDTPLRDFLQPNDVILRVGGMPVNNLNELDQALEQIDLQKEIPLIIFRNQKKNKVVLPAGSIGTK